MTGGVFTSTTRAFIDEITNPVLEKPVDPLELHNALLQVAGTPQAAATNGSSS